MICIICGKAALVQGFSTVTLERLESKIINQRVPSHICPSCGELYIEEEVTLRLLEEADRILEAGLDENEWEYSA
jgi:YgiT-type zinc finger domain-containing protein